MTLFLLQKSETNILTKFKKLAGDKTQKLKCDKTQMKLLQDSQIFSLRIFKTQIVRKKREKKQHDIT